MHAVALDLHLCQCYSVNTPAPSSSKAQALSEEKPFYVFYAHPCDARQEITA